MGFDEKTMESREGRLARIGFHPSLPGLPNSFPTFPTDKSVGYYRMSLPGLKIPSYSCSTSSPVHADFFEWGMSNWSNMR